MMVLSIKNMVCHRCILAVVEILQRLQIDYQAVRMGEVELSTVLSPKKKELLVQELHEIGFEIIDDRKGQIIQKIKNELIQVVQTNEQLPKIHLSKFLPTVLYYEYNYLSGLFSEIVGMTIERFFIAQKIEKVKELLVYDQLSLSEIAWKLGYSSVAHLSNQFKMMTGLAPSHFKKIGTARRQALDEI